MLNTKQFNELRLTNYNTQASQRESQMNDDDTNSQNMGKTPKYDDHQGINQHSSRLGYSLRSSKMVQLKEGSKNYKSKQKNGKGHSNSISLNKKIAQQNGQEGDQTNRAKTAENLGGQGGKRMNHANNVFPARKIKMHDGSENAAGGLPALG